MLRDKVTEFFVKLDDFQQEFTKNMENHPNLVETIVKRRNRQGKSTGYYKRVIQLLHNLVLITQF
mgnify:CR=1 FL=1